MPVTALISPSVCIPLKSNANREWFWRVLRNQFTSNLRSSILDRPAASNCSNSSKQRSRVQFSGSNEFSNRLGHLLNTMYTPRAHPTLKFAYKMQPLLSAEFNSQDVIMMLRWPLKAPQHRSFLFHLHPQNKLHHFFAEKPILTCKSVNHMPILCRNRCVSVRIFTMNQKATIELPL